MRRRRKPRKTEEKISERRKKTKKREKMQKLLRRLDIVATRTVSTTRWLADLADRVIHSLMMRG